MGKRLSGILLALALALAGVGVAATPAQAAVNCSLYKGGVMVEARCTGGTGRYQAVAQCKKRDWWAIGSSSYFAYGPLKSYGSILSSIAICRPGYYVTWGGIGHTR